MTNLKTIDVTVGIYDTEATITRHRNGKVTIKAPFVKWDQLGTGTLAFTRIQLDLVDAEMADAVFSENPPIVTAYGDIYNLSYGEFISHFI